MKAPTNKGITAIVLAVVLAVLLCDLALHGGKLMWFSVYLIIAGLGFFAAGVYRLLHPTPSGAKEQRDGWFNVVFGAWACAQGARDFIHGEMSHQIFLLSNIAFLAFLLVREFWRAAAKKRQSSAS
jgi:hypothetical protein